MHPIIKTALLCLALVIIPVFDVWWHHHVTGFSLLATCGLLALLWVRFIVWYSGRKERDAALLRRARAAVLIDRLAKLNDGRA